MSKAPRIEKADARIAAEIELPGWRAQSAQKADDGC